MPLDYAILSDIPQSDLQQLRTEVIAEQGKLTALVSDKQKERRKRAESLKRYEGNLAVLDRTFKENAQETTPSFSKAKQITKATVETRILLADIQRGIDKVVAEIEQLNSQLEVVKADLMLIDNISKYRGQVISLDRKRSEKETKE